MSSGIATQKLSDAAEEDENGDVEADDVADRHEGRGEVGAHVEEALAPGDAHPPLGRLLPQPEARLAELEQGGDDGGARDEQHALAAALAGLEHLGAGDALGELQGLLDDERAPQGHREQHAQHAAEAGDEGRLQEVEVLPGPEQDEAPAW